MTGFLPPLVPSPFGKWLNGSSYAFDVLDQNKAWTSADNKSTIPRARQISPSSTLSAISTSTVKNNENNPLGHKEDITCPRLGENNLLVKRLEAEETLRNVKGFVPKRLETEKSNARNPEKKETSAATIKQMKKAHRLAALYSPRTVSNESPTGPPQCLGGLERSTKSCNKTERKSRSEIFQERTNGISTKAAKTPTSEIFSRTRQLRQQTSSLHRHSPEPSTGITAVTRHYHRLSDGSSDFIHTVKTASMSNGSFSIMPTSLRLGRSTDSSGLPGSHVRFSLDSERPPTVSSLDDAALRRSLKRRQIIEELILTEESYLADIKALAYLYSTLLASASSISDSVRTSIQRNVASLLQTHEQLLQNLHRAAFRAAARKWAETSTPTRIVQTRRRRLHESDLHMRESHVGKHRHTRSSVDSGEVARAHARLGTADSNDVLDIAAIFKDTMSSLFAYEEYCANHELIARELQKQLPLLWSTYESGMESLAKTVVAIDQKNCNDRKGLTVGDLLIKPIQRICRYPLLIEDLLNHTPVVDSPNCHAELDVVLQRLRDVVQAVNIATGNPYAQIQIQRRWLLQDRLDLSKISMSLDDFRKLGMVELCGILHVTYQTSTAVDGTFALCVLFEEHLLIARPSPTVHKFEAVILVHLLDLSLESATNGEGLQCPSALHTWKLRFLQQDSLHELILSACSKVEEEQWISGLNGDFQKSGKPFIPHYSFPTCTCLDLRSIGSVYVSQRSMLHEMSVQRAATVNSRASISHVILRNTHNAQDLQEYRNPAINAINRSQSHANAKRIPILEPKRSVRARMENDISDIWTRERLPFPGMIGSKGGQIIRASAGSLARKLSLASIQTSFSRVRTPSLTVSSKASYDALNESRPMFEIRKATVEPKFTPRNKPKDIPEVDDMRSVVGRMMAGGTMTTTTASSVGSINAVERNRGEKLRTSIYRVGPSDPAAVFYHDDDFYQNRPEDCECKVGNGQKATFPPMTDFRFVGRRRKRWSNPISMIRGWGSEAKSLIHSGK